MVQDSWAPLACNLEANGVAVFRRIFELAPGALALFSFSGEEDLYNSLALKRHATGVMKMVGGAVAGLLDLELQVPVLRELGRKHARYNVGAAHYEAMGRALVGTVAAALGVGFTAELRRAWTEVYDFVAATMLQGADDEAAGEDEHSARASTNYYATSQLEALRSALGPERQVTAEQLVFGEVIGEGAFGTVYRGTLFKCPVAIKKLHALGSVMLANTKSADEFWRELSILTALDCPRDAKTATSPSSRSSPRASSRRAW